MTMSLRWLSSRQSACRRDARPAQSSHAGLLAKAVIPFPVHAVQYNNTYILSLTLKNFSKASHDRSPPHMGVQHLKTLAITLATSKEDRGHGASTSCDTSERPKAPKAGKRHPTALRGPRWQKAVHVGRGHPTCFKSPGRRPYHAYQN